MNLMDLSRTASQLIQYARVLLNSRPDEHYQITNKSLIEWNENKYNEMAK